MKDDHLHNNQHYWQTFSHHQRRLSNLITNHKFAAYVILLILTYAFGYFSASSSSSSLSSTSKQTISPIPTTVTAPITNSCSLNDNSNDNYHNRFAPPCSEPVPAELLRQKILDRVFNGTSPYDNFPPPNVADLLKPKRVKGWGSNGAVFKNLIKKVRPNTIIEVGTFLGASAIHMAELTRELGLQTQILCLDDFRGWPGFRNRVNYVPMLNGDVLLMAQFLQNVIYFNVTGSIIPVPFSTGSALQKLCEWGVMADLIEVDAGHDFHSAWADINRAHNLLRPGGVIFGHDYFTSYDNKGVRRAVELFAKVKGFKVRADGQHWVIDSS